jgi:hypothetical protein
MARVTIPVLVSIVREFGIRARSIGASAVESVGVRPAREAIVSDNPTIHRRPTTRIAANVIIACRNPSGALTRFQLPDHRKTAR